MNTDKAISSKEGNKLIAEFDGWVEYNDTGNHNKGRIVMQKAGKKSVFLDMMQYHTSWDWLMPVVEKIESMGYTVNMQNHTCYISDDDGHFKEDSFDWIGMEGIGETGITKIEATYNAVIQFITWHQKTQK